MTTDPVERMKLVITANFSWFFYYQTFTKPLNPILGETYQAFGQDGTKVYMEQTSHHPPRSHFIAEGPDNCFTMTGYMDYAIYSGMTSTTVQCGGHKQITFADGGLIRWNQNNDSISGMFVGTMCHQMTGKITFNDEANGIVAYYNYNGYTLKKQDFIWGEIHQNGRKLCEITGNYMGHLDIDGQRYWDTRSENVFFHLAGEDPNALPSQASKRTDGRTFISRPLEEAQEEKERLENIQRNDRKLREAVEQRRAAGGPKHKIFEQTE